MPMQINNQIDTALLCVCEWVDNKGLYTKRPAHEKGVKHQPRAAAAAAHNVANLINFWATGLVWKIKTIWWLRNTPRVRKVNSQSSVRQCAQSIELRWLIQ